MSDGPGPTRQGLPPPRPLSDKIIEFARAAKASKPMPVPQLPPLPNTPPAYTPRILLVDDQEDLLRTCQLIYSTTKLRDHADLEIFRFTAGSFENLLRLLDEASRTERPFDTVYMDRQMKSAGRDGGLGLVKRLRNSLPVLKYTPFVITTAFPDDDLTRKAREMGAIRIIIKANPASQQGIVGSFVHRLVTEARETLEQAEDEIWADANRLVAERLGAGEGWRETAQVLMDFLGLHFPLEATYARQLMTNTSLQFVAGHDALDIDAAELSLKSVPFLRDFLRTSNGQDTLTIQELNAAHLGQWAPKANGLRVTAARIRAADEVLGAITIYRRGSAREFRRRDEEGLHHLASQFAAAMAREREYAQVVTMQKQAVETVSNLQQKATAEDVYVALRDALYEMVHNEKGSPRHKVSVRHLVPGEGTTIRAAPVRGFRGDRPGEPISLADDQGSSIARALRDGEPEYCSDVRQAPGRHTLFADDVRTSWVIPLISRGVILGAAALESTDVDAYSPLVRDLITCLCNSASDALLALRASSFMLGASALFGRVTTDSRSDAEDLVPGLVELIFELTGASDLHYLAEVDGQWTLTKSFVYPGEAEGEAETEAWRAHIIRNWEHTYMKRVIDGGAPAAWTDDPEKIHSDYVLRSGVETRSEAVIKITLDADVVSGRALVLMFTHPRALNDSILDLLVDMGHTLARLVVERTKVLTLYGTTSLRQQEARLGRVFDDIRHRLSHPLVNATAAIGSWRDELLTTDELISDLTDYIRLFESIIERNKAVAKVPQIEPVLPSEVWNKVRGDHLPHALKKGAEILEATSARIINTDPEVLELIFWHLIDNALKHGGGGISIEFQERQRIGGNAFFHIVDNGVGFSREASRTFGLAAPTQVRRGAGSTGLGTYLAAGAANNLGGELSLNLSTKGQTRIQLRIPDPES